MRTQGHSKQQVGTDDDEVKRPPMPSSEAGRDGSQAVPEARSKDSTESRAAFIEHQAVHSGAFPAESTPPDVTYKSPRLAWIAPHLHVHAMASLTGDSTPTYHEELVVAGGNSPLVSDSVATRNESSDRYSRSISSDSFNSMAYRGDRASQPSRDKSAATSMSGTRRDRLREGDEYGDNRSYDDHEESLSLQVGAIAVNGIGARNPSGANDNFPSFDDDTEPATDTTDPVTSDVGKAVGLATAILVSEDDRTMMHQLDPTGPYYAAEEIHEEEVEKGFDGFLRRNSLKICLCVVVLVIGSILGSIFSLRTSMAEEQFDAEALVLKAGSPRFRDAAKRLLRQNVTGREVLLNAPLKTPQYIALEWLADKDQAQIDLSNDVLLIQRYSLAVLFFSSGGDSWTDTLNFTSARNECEWYSMEKDIRHGVAECSEDGAVTQLWLSKLIAGRESVQIIVYCLRDVSLVHCI